MRRSVLAIVLALVSVAASASAQTHSAQDLARARALDKEGAKAYSDGRYNDAIRFFEESHRLGGPPFELWNIAKCHLRLDQPEQAAEVLERYLSTPNLPPDDQKEAAQQLDDLRKRPSTLSIASTPTGATVTIDGKVAEGGGKTPLMVSVPPGAHTVTLTTKDRAPWSQKVEAKYGRAVIIDATLASDDRPPPPDNPYADSGAGGGGGASPLPETKWAARGFLGVQLPRFGGVSGDAGPAFILDGTYAIARIKATTFAVGALMSIAGDGWKNTVNAPTQVQGCGTLESPNGATAFGLFGIGTAGIDLVPRLRASALAGLGFSTEFIGQGIGGDVFDSSCTTSPGARPAFLVGGQIDYAVSDMVRLSAQPISLQFNPAYAGVRSTPKDAGGLWMRATLAIGAGIDF